MFYQLEFNNICYVSGVVHQVCSVVWSTSARGYQVWQKWLCQTGEEKRENSSPQTQPRLCETHNRIWSMSRALTVSSAEVNATAEFTECVCCPSKGEKLQFVFRNISCSDQNSPYVVTMGINEDRTYQSKSLSSPLHS